MEEHRKSPSCASCHVRMDPIGLALENYDPIGRWRDADQGQPIDVTGQLEDGRTFDGPAALARVIKTDPRFAECATEKIFTYAIGRTRRAGDDTRVAALTKGFADGEHRTKALIASIIHNDAFRMRRGGT
jgi:hypothetical protein